MESCQTVFLCEPLEGHQGLVVIPISAIWTGMVVSQEGHIEQTGKFLLMRHLYIELSKFSIDGFADDEDGGDEDVE